MISLRYFELIFVSFQENKKNIKFQFNWNEKLSYLLGIISAQVQISIYLKLSIYLFHPRLILEVYKIKKSHEIQRHREFGTCRASFTNSISCRYIKFKSNGISLYLKKILRKAPLKSFLLTFLQCCSVFVHTFRKITKINWKPILMFYLEGLYFLSINFNLCSMHTTL